MLREIVGVLWIVDTILSAFLLVRLIVFRLPYRSFAVFLGVCVSLSIFLSCFPLWSRSYYWAWLWSDFLILGLQVAIVEEFFTLLKGSYPNIGLLATRTIAHCRRIALAACILGAALTLGALDWTHAGYRLSFLLKRGFATTLGLSLIAVLLCAHYAGKAHLKPNLLRHARIMAAYFTVNALLCFLSDTGRLPLKLLAIITQVFNVGCLVAWIFALTRAGEIQPTLEPLLPGEMRASFAVLDETAEDIAAAVSDSH
jgi:hypothetical protein